MVDQESEDNAFGSGRKPEEEMRERMMRLAERSPYNEMVESGGKWEIRHAVRVTCANIEQEVVVEHESRPNTYPATLRLQSLQDRRYAVPFTYAQWPQERGSKRNR